MLVVGCDVAVLHRHVGGGLQMCRCRTATLSIVTVACYNRTRTGDPNCAVGFEQAQILARACWLRVF